MSGVVVLCEAVECRAGIIGVFYSKTFHGIQK